MFNRSHRDKGRARGHRGRRLLIGAAMLAVLACSGCGSEQEIDPDPVAIEVGERSIRLSELQSQVDFLTRSKVPLAYDKQAFIEHIVERSIALEKARESGLHEDPEIQRQIENLLIGRLKQRELNLALDSVSVSEEELQAFYEANAHKYGRPAQARFALLFLPTAKFMDEAAKQAQKERMREAKQLAADLDADTGGFGELAMKYSEEGTSRFKGGDIGWLPVGRERYRWPDAVVDAGFALEIGETSEVIETDEGYYLLKKTDGREVVRPALEGRFAASMKNALLREKREKIADEFEKEWAAGVDLKIHEDAISRLEIAASRLETTGGSAAPRKLP